MWQMPYKVEEPVQVDNPESAYGICKNLNYLMREDSTPDFVKKSVKSFFKGYVGKLEADQKAVDEQLMDFYNSDPSQLEKKRNRVGYLYRKSDSDDGKEFI